MKGTDGLLAMDRNGNGVIDNITELYGDDVKGVSAFGKLGLEDSNHDGVKVPVIQISASCACGRI